MKTKVGSVMVKKWSKQMDKLNEKMRDMGQTLLQLEQSVAEKAYTKYVDELIVIAHENRKQHADLQAKITALVCLEQYVKGKLP